MSADALAESVIGLYKTEVIRKRGLGAISRRCVREARVGGLVQHPALLELIGYTPPMEFSIT